MDVVQVDHKAPLRWVVPTDALTVILRRWTLVGMIVVLCMCSLIPILAGAYLYGPSDDVYITLTYARSIAQGNGFRTFPDAPSSLGTTTPLNAIVLAVLSRLLPNTALKDIAVRLSVLMWIATGWLWALGGTRLGLNQIESLCIGVLILLEGPSAGFLGFEYKFFFLVLSISLITYAEKRFVLTGILCAVAFLIRGEGLLLLGTLCLHQLLQAKAEVKGFAGLAPLGERLFMLLGGFALIFAVWAVYAKLTIGEVFPTTLQAKLAQVVALKSHATAAVGFIEALTASLNNLGMLYVGAFQFTLWLVVGSLGIVYAAVFRQAVLPLVLWGVVFAIGYSLLNTATYGWYALQLDFVLVVLSGLAIGAVFSLAERVADALKLPLLTVVGAVICGVLLTRATFVVAQNNIPTKPIITPRTFDLTQLAIWVNVNTEPGTTVAHQEVGMLQWYANRRIVDLLGLLNPEIVPVLFHYGATLAPAFEMMAPDYWIDNRTLLDPTIRYSDYFIQNYMLVDTYAGTEGGQYYMYRRGLSGIQTTAQDLVFDPKTARTDFITKIGYGADGSVSGTGGIDPYFEWKNLSLCTEDYPYLIIDLSVAKDVESDSRFLTVLYAPDGQPIEGERSYGTRELSTDAMQRYIINTKLQLPRWHGVMDRLRFDPIVDAGESSGEFTLKQVRLVRGAGGSHCAESAITAIPTTPNDVMLDLNVATTHQVKSATFTAAGVFQIVVESDPWLVWSGLNLCADDYPTMLIEMSAPAKMKSASRIFAVFYTPPNTPVGEERSLRVPLVDGGEMHQYMIDLPAKMPDWTGRISTLRLDPVADAGNSSEPIVIKQIRLVRGAGDSKCK